MLRIMETIARIGRDTLPHDRHRGHIAFVFVLWLAALPLATTISPAFAIAATPTAPNASLSAAVSKGSVGTRVDLSATGFAAGESLTFQWDGGSTLATAGTSASGTATATVVVPPSTNGSHKIVATGATSRKQASTSFTVTPSVTATQGIPGTSVTIAIQGFGAAETVRLTWQSATGSSLGTIATAANGSGSTSIAVPVAAAGSHPIVATGATSKAQATGTLAIVASLALTPKGAAPGAKIAAKAVGLPANTAVSLTLSPAATALCAGTTGADGTFACDFAIPSIAAGPYTVAATAGITTASVPLSISGTAPVIAATPASGAPGTRIALGIGGFAPNETVAVTWPGLDPWQSVKTDAYGVATLNATIPQVAAGTQTITAVAATSKRKATTTFTVTQTIPVGASAVISTGTYRVTATREGLVGSTTSSGHVIATGDYFVSLPACTPTNCPGGPYWGQMTNCGSKCYVKVTNPATGQCRVDPILDVGPWFRVDDWWNPTATRYLNTLASNPNKLAQGVPGAEAARSGLDVGYGVSGGIGSSDAYSQVGNASAIDLADGTWTGIGFPISQALTSNVTVQMLWQTGTDPATAAAACGHPLNQSPGGNLALTPTSGQVGTSATLSGSGYKSGETVSIYWDSTSGMLLKTATVASNGTFSATIGIPQATYGSHKIVTKGGTSGKSETATFSVQPSLSRTPISGVPGTRVTVTVQGFGAGETVQLNWDSATGAALGSVRTNSAGTGSVVITIPSATVGWHDYTGLGQTTGARAYGAIQVLETSTLYATGTVNPAFSGANLRAVSGISIAPGSTKAALTYDDSLSTSWYTTTANPGTNGIFIDYGAVKQLTGVRWIFNRAGGAPAFTVQTSIDRVTWSTVGTFSGGVAATWYGIALGRNGRYLKITFTNPTNVPVLGYLGEAQLWGRDLASPPLYTTGSANPSFSGSNLAATNSWTETTGTTASGRARDGSLNTSWYTITANPGTVSVDFDYGTVRQLTGVKWVFNQSGGAAQFLVQTSTDRVTWKNVGTFSGGNSLSWYGIALGRTGRYLRFTFSNPTNAPVLGYLAEVQLWGANTTMAAASVAAPAGGNPTFGGSILPIVASSSSTNTSAPARAYDGNTGTSWYTTNANPTSAVLTLDLGKTQQLTGVKWMYRLSGGADRLIVTVSTDGATWTQLVTATNRQPLTWDGVATTKQARFVRLTFQNPRQAPVLGYVAEVQVWGTPAATRATPAASPAASPMASPRPAGTPAASPVAGTPVASPRAGTPIVSATANVATPLPATPAPGGTPIAPTPASAASPAPDTTGASTPLAPPTIAVTPTLTPTTDVATPTAAATGEASPKVVPPTDIATATVLPPISTATSTSPSQAATVAPAVGYVVGTGGDGAFCRTEPSSDGPVIALLPEGTELQLTGDPTGDWQPVICDDQPGYIFSSYVGSTPDGLVATAVPSPTATTIVTDEPSPTAASATSPSAEPNDQATATLAPTSDSGSPAVTPPARMPTGEPTAGSPDEPTPAATLEPTPTFAPTATPTAEPQFVTSQLTIDASSDASVSQAGPGTPVAIPVDGALAAGGPDSAVAVFTFDVEGIASGTVVDARLILTGAGATGGDGGQLLVAPGVWFDGPSVTADQVAETPLQEVGPIGDLEPGATTTIDVTGVVSADGAISFVIPGTPDQEVGIASIASGSPAQLVLTVQTLVDPGAGQ